MVNINSEKKLCSYQIRPADLMIEQEYENNFILTNLTCDIGNLLVCTIYKSESQKYSQKPLFHQ
jgi:hypothetical protein